jgi:hypothetical protein
LALALTVLAAAGTGGPQRLLDGAAGALLTGALISLVVAPAT